jgi:hypothetical protein
MYDKLGNPVIKLSVDQLNKVFFEEKFYYKDNILVRQTKDEDIATPDLNEDRLYDKNGNATYYFWQLPNSPNVQIIKAFYKLNGLKDKEEYFFNGSWLFSVLYNYK